MKAFRLLVAVALLFAFLAQVSPAHAQGCGPGSGYYVASLNAGIDPGAADFLSSAVSNAKAACDGNFVLVLSTNGGSGTSMESMIETIIGYEGWGGNFSTLVAPQGSHAWSAGAYIAEASNKIYMVAGTSIGAATPIVSGIPTGEESGVYAKDIGAFATYMENLASVNHRNGTAAALMVTIPAQTYSADDASRLHVIDGVVSGATTQDALAALGVPANTPIDTPGIRAVLISVFSDPNVSSLLFLIGVFSILADIYHPTLVLSVVGVVIIALALFGLGIFGASPLAVALMIIGAAFVFLEVKTQHGISALVGVIIFIVGFLFVYQFPPAPSNPSLPAANFSGIPDVTFGLLVALGAAVVIGSLYLRRIRQGLMTRPKVFDSSSTVGRKGEMKSDLSPGKKGVALIGAETWSVTSSQELKTGDPVRVIAVDGLELVVEKLQT